MNVERTSMVSVGMGELHVTRDTSISLACLGLGSCIGIAAYDPVSRVGGMVHIVLPVNNNGHNPAKYANTAIPRLLEEMSAQGAVTSRIVVKLAGGAHLLHAAGFEDAFQLGKRNLEETVKTLANQGIRPLAMDTGGNHGRSIWLFVSSGKVIIRVAGMEPREL